MRKIGGDSEQRAAVYTDEHEDSSTESTNKFSIEVGFGKKSNRIDLGLWLCVGIFLIAFWIYFYILKKQGAEVFWPTATTQDDYFGINWEAMHGHVFSSLLYYHVQLPFYLLYVYLFEYVWFPPNGFLGYYILNTLAGLCMVYSVYQLQILLNVPKKLAVVLILFYVTSPAFYLNYSMGWHDFLTSCLVAFSCYLFVRASMINTFKRYFAFFMLIAFICNIRALYHPIIFFIPLLVYMLITNRNHSKKILLAVLLPLSLSLLPYIKNWIMFDTFNVSTHSGRVMVQTTYEFSLSNELKEKFVKQGQLSPLVFCIHGAGYPDMVYEGVRYDSIYCQQLAKKYADAYVARYPQYQQIPFLMSVGANQSNMNYLGNIGINQENTKNALKSFYLYPKEFFDTLPEKTRILIKPNVSYYFGNMQNLRHLPDWVSYNILNFWPGNKNIPGVTGNLEKRGSLFLALGIPLLLLYAGMSLLAIPWLRFFNRIVCIFLVGGALSYLIHLRSFSAWDGWDIEYKIINFALSILGIGMLMSILFVCTRLKKHKSLIANNFFSTQGHILTYIVFLVLYNSVMTIMLVGAEHQRYRQYIDPLLLVLLGSYLNQVWLRLNDRLLA